MLRYWKDNDMQKAGDRFGQYAVSTHLPSHIGMSQDGTKDLDELFNAKIFSFPKPVSLIKHLIDGAVEKDKDEPIIILDFFSGSGTTAQAVMELNSVEDGYNLQYILVQLPEKIKPNTEAYKEKYKTIDQIGQERIRRAAAKIKSENHADIDYGFKHYTPREPDENTLDRMEKFVPTDAFGNDLVKAFGKETVLATYAVRDGYGLTPKIEPVKFGNYTAWLCGKHLYMIDQGFDILGDDLTELVDKYNKDHSFTADTVVIFGYSFNFGQTDAIKKKFGCHHRPQPHKYRYSLLKPPANYGTEIRKRIAAPGVCGRSHQRGVQAGGDKSTGGTLLKPCYRPSFKPFYWKYIPHTAKGAAECGGKIQKRAAGGQHLVSGHQDGNRHRQDIRIYTHHL